jgi:PEP-CTERM motif
MSSHLFRRQFPSFLAIFALGAIGAVSHLHAQSLAITGVVSETVGTTASLVAPDLSGTEANTATFNTGVAGVFTMTGGLYMVVSTSNNTGSLVTGRDALMVARTVNSQGLTDNGTLSIYVRNPVSTAPGAAMGTTQWSVDVNFSFFSDAGLTTAAPTNLLLTSLDIDFAQRYYTSNTSFTSNTTYFGADGTNLITAPAQSGYTGYTTAPGANSLVNNPEHAVSSGGTGSSFDIQLSHNAVALFMFEFRNPPTVITIPEPSSALFVMGGVSAFGLMRRRQRTA